MGTQYTLMVLFVPLLHFPFSLQQNSSGHKKSKTLKRTTINLGI